MEGVSGSGFTFVNDDLDGYLDNLESKFSASQKEPRACALTHLGALESARKTQGAYSTSVTREFEGPKSISCFDYEIKLSSPVVQKTIAKFPQEPCGLKNIQVLSNLRFPPKLKSCYVKNFDFEKEALEQAKYKKPKTRRKPRRTRFSLSENVHVNDDNYRRSNLLPTEDDLRTAYDKVFPCRAIPYVYGCSEKSNSGHDCASRCAEIAKGFRIFVEVPQNGRRPPPIVSENLEKIRNESGVVDDISAMVAATAVRSLTPSTSRIFVPLSQDLADRIGILSEVFDVDDDSLVEDPEVCRVVEDIVEFVDKQSEFPDLDFDPDGSLDDSFTLDGSKEDASQNPNDICPSDDSSTSSPIKILQKIRKKKRTEKNKVVRELKKLLNISVKDEDEGTNPKEDACEESTCVLGCICASLNVKPPPSEHCGRVECIFECSCTEKKYFYVNEGELAKEEKSWHQTVVRKKGNAVELQSGLERSKRQSKPPSKYEDTFTGQHLDHIVQPRKRLRDRERLDDDFEADMDKHSQRSSRRRVNDDIKSEDGRSTTTVDSPVDDSDESLAPKIVWEESTNRRRSDSLKKKCIEIKKDLLNSRLALCGTENVKTLDQVFIWCTMHDKYDCHCSNYIVMTRNCNLLHRAVRTNRYTAKRLLSQVKLKNAESPESRIVKLWDEKHCARSVGAIMNYALRNKTREYKRMMKRVLVDAKVSSFSNGYIKTKPIATIMPQELYDNFPLSGFPMCGVGTIATAKKGDIIKAPEGSMVLTVNDGCSMPGFNSMDSEVVAKTRQDRDSSLTELDSMDPKSVTAPRAKKRKGKTLSWPESDFMDVSSEIVPMPRKRSSESFESCLSFSSQNVSKKSQFSPRLSERRASLPRAEQPRRDFPDPQDTSSKPNIPLIDLDTPVQFDAESGDSDVEFVEEPMEIFSIGSSSDDEGESKPSDSSGIQPSKAPSSSSDTTVPICSVKPIMVESEIKVESPIVIESEDENAYEDDDNVEPSNGPSSVEGDSPLSTAPCSPQETPVSLNEVGGANLEEEYPLFGLCNLQHKEYGYVPLLDTSGTKLNILIPGSNHCSRVFHDAKEASKFMLALSQKYFDIPRDSKAGEWCKVTRGVLKKLNVKKFPNPELLTLRSTSPQSPSEPAAAVKLPPKSKSPVPIVKLPVMPNSQVQQQASRVSKLEKKKAKLKVAAPKQLIRPFPLARAQKEEPKSAAAPLPAPPVSGSAEIVPEPAAPEKNSEQPDPPSSFPSSSSSSCSTSSSSDEDKSTPAVSATSVNRSMPTVVGTFPSMSEANLFLKKNFNGIVQSQLVRALSPTVAYTTLKSITSASVNASPGPNCQVVHLQRGKQILLPSSMLASRFPGVKLPAATPQFVKGHSGKLTRCNLVQVPTQVVAPNGAVSTVTKTVPVETKVGTASSTNQPPLNTPLKIIMPRRPQLIAPGGQPLRLSGTGPILISNSSTQAAAGKTVFSAVPRSDFVPTGVRIRGPLRRADVIVARDTGFATVISPTPGQLGQPPKTAPNDNKVVYNGVVITKPDAPKPEPPKAVICGKNSTTNFKSLLAQKSPPKSANPPTSANP